MNLLVMHDFTVSYYFLPLMRSKYFPQHFILKLLQYIGITRALCFVHRLVFYLLLGILDKVQTPNNRESCTSSSDSLEIYFITLYSSPTVTDQVSHPNKAKGKIIFCIYFNRSILRG
jgi:hypothetical protein